MDSSTPLIRAEGVLVCIPSVDLMMREAISNILIDALKQTPLEGQYHTVYASLLTWSFGNEKTIVIV